MPLRLYPDSYRDTKAHKTLYITLQKLVRLCGLVPWWQKKLF